MSRLESLFTQYPRAGIQGRKKTETGRKQRPDIRSHLCPCVRIQHLDCPTCHGNPSLQHTRVRRQGDAMYGEVGDAGDFPLPPSPSQVSAYPWRLHRRGRACQEKGVECQALSHKVTLKELPPLQHHHHRQHQQRPPKSSLLQVLRTRRPPCTQPARPIDQPYTNPQPASQRRPRSHSTKQHKMLVPSFMPDFGEEEEIRTLMPCNSLPPSLVTLSSPPFSLSSVINKREDQLALHHGDHQAGR